MNTSLPLMPSGQVPMAGCCCARACETKPGSARPPAMPRPARMKSRRFEFQLRSCMKSSSCSAGESVDISLNDILGIYRGTILPYYAKTGVQGPAPSDCAVHLKKAEKRFNL